MIAGAQALRKKGSEDPFLRDKIAQTGYILPSLLDEDDPYLERIVLPIVARI